MVCRRSRARALAAILVLTGAVVALLLPTYTCRPPYKLFRIQLADQTSEEVVCLRSDMGYAPRSWNPTKIAIAAGGVALGIAILLGARRKLTSLAVVLVHAALTIGWFLPNGYVQPTRSGVSVCCQREIDRSAWRAAIPATGLTLGGALVLAEARRSKREAAPTKTPGATTTARR